MYDLKIKGINSRLKIYSSETNLTPIDFYELKSRFGFKAYNSVKYQYKNSLIYTYLELAHQNASIDILKLVFLLSPDLYRIIFYCPVSIIICSNLIIKLIVIIKK